MNFNDLGPEDQELLNTNFGETLEKEAAEQAGQINQLYAGGAELAEQDADVMEKMAAEGKDGDKDGKEGDDEKKKASEKLDEGQKKEACARGAFIARGYIENLMKLGSERYDDELTYLYPYLEEKVAGIRDLASKAVGAGKKFAKGVKSDFTTATKGTKKAPWAEALGKKSVPASKGERAVATGKLVGKSIMIILLQP